MLADREQTVDTPPELPDTVTAFMGGTLFTGMTCRALAAGVMALGLATGKVEDSRPRVLRMIGTMAVGGNAFADELNEFNRVMNLGHKLARWFKAEFASTQCRALTRSDFASAADVREYIERDGTAECERIGHRVAARVAEMVRSLVPAPPPRSGVIRGRTRKAGR